MINRFRIWWASAESNVKVHRFLKWLWILVGIPLSFTVFYGSINWLIFMSIYAIIISHWSAEIAGIVGKKQEEQND